MQYKCSNASVNQKDEVLIESTRRFNKFSCPVDRREITASSYTISTEEWAYSFPTDDLAQLLLQAISDDGNTQAKPKNGVPCSEHPQNIYVLPLRAFELEPFLPIQVEPIGLENNITARFTGLILHGRSIIAIDNANFIVQRFRDTVENQFIDEVLIPCIYDITNIHENDDVLVIAPGKQSRLIRLSTYNSLSIISEKVTENTYFNISQLPDHSYAVMCQSSRIGFSKKKS
ncbi:unnamed protein product [Mytilus coruscus]|uniref:Uncharacterized protein n=1 Tax=Mytilus coruscus TaxID=42192 RepID=A0A6J8B7L9_MYTCO|nr:unnamed protein product [Mytilus coruscus]